jgi:hypothetical protein
MRGIRADGCGCRGWEECHVDRLLAKLNLCVRRDTGGNVAKRSKLGLALGAAVSAIGFVLPSAVLGSTVVIGPTTYGPYSGGTSGNFSIPQYSGPGTLTSVELTVTGDSYGGSNALQNLSDEPGNATVEIGSNITVTGPSSLVVLTQPNQSATGPVTANVNPPLTYTGSDAISITGTSSSDTQSDTITAPPTDLSPYVGAGDVTVDYSSTVNNYTSSTVSPEVSQSSPPTYDFTATVTYTYSVVPEPASLGLIVAALPLLAARRRRHA